MEEYKAAQSQAGSLQLKFRDSLDDKSSPLARSLESEIQAVVDDLQVERNPRGIEDRIKQVQRLLKDTQHAETPIISPDAMNFLHERFEALRMELRKLPNYN